ncbi:integrase [Streptomyces lavendulae]|uniref:integrase n=1 Tax=Streptomyces lavendulae TaxID=1914 RepID=UPI0036B35FB1
MYLATHRNVFYGADALAHTARLIIDTGHTDPHGLLPEAGRTRAWLSRLLADFFHTHHLLDAPADIQSKRAETRRERRIEAVPAPLRPAVRAFAEVLVARRENAERLGLRPNQLKTIEIRLDTVRDLALHLHAKGHTTWAGVNATGLEAFLARNPARRASWLAGLQQFFAHAHRTGLVLHDPAAAMAAPQPRGFSGSTLTLDEQRALYRRWSAGEGVLPHEAFIGLAALLHAATTTELRHLTLADLATASRTVRFPGRSVDLALDDATWWALEACLAHRRALRTDNPHVLVTRPGRRSSHPRQPRTDRTSPTDPALHTAAHPCRRTRHQAAHRGPGHVLRRNCPLPVAL